MLAISCLRCGAQLQVQEQWAGKPIRCGRCQNLIVAPAVAPAAGGVQATLPPGPAAGAPADKPGADPELTAFLAPPQVPDELGRLGLYRILGVLGSGGMGIVFRAEDSLLQRPVALKVLRPALAASAVNRQRFLREARAAAIEHDYIVTIYQTGEDRGLPFLAMQLLQGETLEARLRREPRLPVREVLRIGREAAEGLAVAHERGVVHRDIKPGNLWLEADRHRVKLLDFGLARAVCDDAHLTQTGAVLGSPGYVAPEQVRGGTADPRSDLFSLGCVLYRACTGELPFQGADTLARLAALAVDTPRPVHELNPAVPPALAGLVMRLLAKDPAARPPSARAVVEALQAIEREGRDAPARAMGTPGRAAESVPLRRLAPTDFKPASAGPGLQDVILLDEAEAVPVKLLPVARVERVSPPRRALTLWLVLGGAALVGLLATILIVAGLLALHGWPAGAGAAHDPKGAQGKAARWTVLFRADDPALWNTNHPGPQFGLPLDKAPDPVRFLRLRRMDTGEALILCVTGAQLGKGNMPTPQEGCWWNGTASDEYGARHLGIVQAPRFRWPHLDGVVSVMNDGWDAFRGSGFGHLCMRDHTGQHYCWRGQEIPRTVFEIAVTGDPLDAAEQRCLLK
jgi:hypothetical protein